MGLLVTLLCWTQFEKPRDAHPRPFPSTTVADWGQLIVWLGALQVMPDTGKDADWFASAPDRDLWPLINSAIGFVAFQIIWELTEKYPIVDLSLFKNPQFRPGHAWPSAPRAMPYLSANTLLMPLWSANPDRLHRDVGGAGGGAGRRDRGVAGRCSARKLMAQYRRCASSPPWPSWRSRVSLPHAGEFHPRHRCAAGISPCSRCRCKASPWRPSSRP